MNVQIQDNLLVDAPTRRMVEEYVPDRETLFALSEFFYALSDSTRIKILSALSIAPLCVGDLAALLGLNRTTVSHQLRTLRLAGAVDYRRQGKVSFYSVSNKRVLDVMLSAAECI